MLQYCNENYMYIDYKIVLKNNRVPSTKREYAAPKLPPHCIDITRI